MERKLLAIVAADMVGFSRLVENNEIEILKRQKKHFIEILNRLLTNIQVGSSKQLVTVS